jgi:hypothetical protein
MVQGLRLRIQDARFRVQDAGFVVHCRVQGLGLGSEGLRVHGVGCSVKG